MTAVKRVCIESPLRGNVARNVRYADACLQDSLRRGEAPFAGHLLYPRVLNDELPVDRRRGIEAHLAWLPLANLVAVYENFGLSEGMWTAIKLARKLDIPVEYRKLLVADGLAAVLPGTPGFFIRGDG